MSNLSSFSHRLPELCDSINRKLGGPVIVKPSKSRSLKRSSSKRDQRPGAVTKRPTPGKPTRTLQRALSTEQQSRRSVSRGPSNMIALMRSATSTSLPGIKREASDSAAIKSTLKAEPDLLNRRGGLLSRSSSMSNLQDARASKKAQVEAELKDAISSLRKPNREVVGKALAEAAERRATVSLSAKSESTTTLLFYRGMLTISRSQKACPELPWRFGREGYASEQPVQGRICIKV